MTYPYPPYPPAPAPVAPRQPNYAKVIALVAIGLLVFVAVGVVVFAYQFHHNNAASTAGGGRAPASVTSPGTPEEWFAAVCRPGSFRNGPSQGTATLLPNADAVSSCSANPPANTFIVSGTYSSDYLATNDAERYSSMNSSARIVYHGQIWLFIAMVDTVAHLAVERVDRPGRGWAAVDRHRLP